MSQAQDPFERWRRRRLKTAGDEENSQRDVGRAEARGRQASERASAGRRGGEHRGGGEEGRMRMRKE